MRRVECLWCSRRLPRPSRTVWAPAEGWNPPTHCSGCSGAWDRIRGRWESIGSGDGLFRCLECQGEQHGTRKRRIVSRTPVHEKAGRYGDGYFCGLACGYRFACTLADAGYR